MNLNNWSTNRKIIAILIVLLMIGGIILTIFLVQRQQDNRSRATKATVLSLTPATQDASPGEDVVLNVHLDPGTNRVNAMTLVIDYDPDKFTADASSFKVDRDTVPFLTPLEGPVVTTPGEIAVTLDTGSDITKVISAETSIAKLTLKVKDSATAGASEVKFNTAANKTEVKSTNLPSDSFGENVLSSTLPATITVSGDAPACRPNIATCSWDSVNGAVSYEYSVTEIAEIISDLSTASTLGDVVASGTVDAPATSVTFDSVPGKTYRCEVRASNLCGTGTPGLGADKCPVPSPSPSPEESPSPSPSPSPEESPSPEVTEVPSPTDTPEVTEAPSPTETPIPTEVVTTEVTATPTPIPMLPPTGNPFVLGGVIGGFLFVLGGLALLIL